MLWLPNQSPRITASALQYQEGGQKVPWVQKGLNSPAVNLIDLNITQVWCRSNLLADKKPKQCLETARQQVKCCLRNCQAVAGTWIFFLLVLTTTCCCGVGFLKNVYQCLSIFQTEKRWTRRERSPCSQQGLDFITCFNSLLYNFIAFSPCFLISSSNT